MVDTRDLKSLGHNGCAGSSPAFGTKNGVTSHVMLLRFFIAINLVYNGIDTVCLTRFPFVCIFASGKQKARLIRLMSKQIKTDLLWQQ